MKPIRSTLALTIAVACVTANYLAWSAEHPNVSLAGEWRFALDRADAGVNEKWFARDLADKIKLPGVLQAQGYGDEISTNTPWVLSLYDKLWFQREDYTAYAKPGSVKVPFVCQPPRHYLGAAWYQRDIEIPKDWVDRRVVLFLERVNWESRVWLDDQLIGTNNSLCTPHEYDLGIVRPGKHRVTVRVDNRMILPYRPDAHSISDSLGQSWNGIVGKLELQCTTLVWIESAQIIPHLARNSALLRVRVGNQTGRRGKAVLWLDNAFRAVEWET
ncbi:MAG: beta-glucuronidase, partial [Verrucomicrobia bacterium]